MFIQNCLLYFFVSCSIGYNLYPMHQKPTLREIASLQASSTDSESADPDECYQGYMAWIQQKFVAHALPNISPSLVGLYHFLNSPSSVNDDIGTRAPAGQLAANSNAFHASTIQLPYKGYRSLIQRELIAQVLFDRDALLSHELIAFLCDIKMETFALYQDSDLEALPRKVRHCSLKQLIKLLTSDKKNTAYAGRKILKQRSIELQQILQEKDGNGDTALAKESARMAINKDYCSKTLLNPALYDRHLTPFVAALRTNTLCYLPDSNVFKVTYAQATSNKGMLDESTQSSSILEKLKGSLF